MEFALSILFGLIVGFTLGLTGGGGGVFAVPLLVYGLALTPREAVGVSLASVGATALFGVAQRLGRGELDVRAGAIVAVAGMIGAPIGTWLSGLISERTLLLLFSGLMMLIAAMMWRKSRRTDLPGSDISEGGAVASCSSGSEVRFKMFSPCAAVLLGIGVLTGALSGLFGVGGGFVIVPALVLIVGMPIQKAVATSLMVIALVSVSGVSSYVISGGYLAWSDAALFVVGGIAGIRIGSRLMSRLSSRRLQQVFAVAVVGVALFVVAKSLA
ncbi:MAG: sulfite exporter TauE/SafE family protein [Pirellulales bacterium]